MLIPRFTVRQLLLITTGCAFAALTVSLAVRQQAWALAVSLALASVALAALFSALLFFAAWVISLVMPEGRSDRTIGLSSVNPTERREN